MVHELLFVLEPASLVVKVLTLLTVEVGSWHSNHCSREEEGGIASKELT